jgi:GT2 family glycosyltransferase
MNKSFKPKITVTIPTFNREDILVDTIMDVLSQSEKDLELIVIDQTKKHKPKTELAISHINDPRFRYYKTSPPSQTIARNFALEHARSPYIIFLDDDVKIDSKLVETFLKTFEKMPNVSAIGGRVLQDGFPIKKDVLKFDEFAISHGVFTATDPGFTNAFPGGNCALKVKDTLAVNGFDTRYRGNAFREESDMSLKMIRAGYSIYYQPKAELLHLAVSSGGNRVKTHIYDNPGFYRNEMFFTLRFAEKGHKLRAFRKKYREYCVTEDRKIIVRRSLLFCLGILAAIWRILFVKQRKAKEL